MFVASVFRRNLAVLAAAMSLAFAQASLSVKDVMKRVEGYVASYGEKASVVVCSERYEQRAFGAGASGEATRTLLSDFAIVRADAIRGWLGFRDVIEVDGRRVGDRDDRLASVLMASQGRFDEARRLSDEGARFNIGAIERNFNVPTSALFSFTPDNHDRFKFAARAVVNDGLWEIAFRETRTPTLIRTPEGRAVYSSGTICVRPDSGTIVRTMLELEMTEARGRAAQHGRGFVAVDYRPIETLGMWLPATMDESFEVRREGAVDRVSGHAEYSNCRQFMTAVRIK